MVVGSWWAKESNWQV